jgi:DNA-directed RNA polymerase subunit RPC12/RpoP
MQTPVECWCGCGEEFVASSPSRGSDELTAGVRVKCPHCNHPYIFTVDGDGEPDLQDAAEDSGQLGQNITGHDSERSTNF